MTMLDLLDRLRQLDIRVSTDGERLKINAPKGALTEDVQRQLREHKAELLSFLQTIDAEKQAADDQANEPPLVRVPRDGSLRPTQTQEGVWFLDQVNPGTTAYNLPIAYRLKGPLDVDALQGALTEIVQRHESLRMTFTTVEGEPHLVIAEAGSVEFTTVDLTDIPANEREAQAQQRVNEEAQRTMDLSRGPLFRCVMFVLGDGDAIVMLAMHHIVSDMWSVGVLNKELSALYRSLHAGRPSDLPELPIQYVDFASWQREWLNGNSLRSQAAYWRKTLSGAPTTLELPYDRPRPLTQSFSGAKAWVPYPDDLYAAVKNIAQRAQATPFVVLLAAFQILMGRLAGQDDVLVGSPISGRIREETEDLIGFFATSIVLRGNLEGNPSFLELVGRIRDTVFEAVEHQELPLEMLVRELHPDRDPSRNPLFQVMFSQVDTAWDSLDLPGIESSNVPCDSHGAVLDLTFYMYLGQDDMTAMIEYNTALFDAASVSRFGKYFQTLLEGIVADPSQSIASLPLLDPDQRQQLVESWNDTECEFPREDGLHELFERQCDRRPDAVAVAFQDSQLTYGELEQRANQLATHLRELEVGPGSLVGIYVERSLEMLVALLGILKSGAAYLPLDPDFPQERLSFMVEDADVKVLVSQEHLPHESFASVQQVVCVDRDREAIAQRSSGRPDKLASPEDLAYVIYTSGSTGRPKGVQIPHRAAVNFLSSVAKRPGLSESDVLLAVTTTSFDISVLELFLPLSVGARVIVVDKATALDGPQLAETLKTSAATLMQATPATWRLLFAAGYQGSPDLTALCGGEALPRDLARELVTTHKSVWNMYGPTETTVWSTCHELVDPEGTVLVGRPLDNTRIYILDELMRPVPVGVTGELYIGGEGLARGYLNRPDQTAERFLDDPFVPGGRIYRTGDLARFRADGNVEYVSRNDGQIKLRGFRIELGEIESLLNQQPEVREAVVVVVEYGPDDKRLVGYVVPEAGQTVLSGALSERLRVQLPSYMIPAHWVELESLPLTANNKVDRKSLPRPSKQAVSSGAPTALPETETEQRIAELWQTALSVPQVGLHDTFFDLGGHSLLALSVIHQMEQALGHRFSALELSMQSLAQLAAISDGAGTLTASEG